MAGDAWRPAADAQKLAVALVGESDVTLAGSIDCETRTFSYEESYLGREAPVPLSLSLPLEGCSVPEQVFRPYFEGLLPEGEERRALAAELAVREDDYLAILASSALDCIGDVAVAPSGSDGLAAMRASFADARYDPMTASDLSAALASSESVAQASLASRLSLTGTQHKVGVARLPGCHAQDDWLRPIGGAASTHIVKSGQLARIPQFEYLSMQAAGACGLNVPESSLVDLGLGQLGICVVRYDRVAWETPDGGLHVRRLHQEDATQALGLTTGSKYAELESSTARRVADLLRASSSNPLADLAAYARLCLFNYLVGNCDNHLKNLSLLHEGAWVRLAPAYDLVPTTVFERFSRSMSMAIGEHRVIDDVVPGDFALLAGDLGLAASALRRMARELTDRIVPAVMAAGEKDMPSGVSLEFDAEDLVDDMFPRLEVLGEFARG